MDQGSPSTGLSSDTVSPRIDAATIDGEALRGQSRVLAVVAAARHHGTEMRAVDFRPTVGEAYPSPASLAAWARDSGLFGKADRVRWSSLFKLIGAQNPPAPIVLLFKDGTAALMVAGDAARNIVC